MSRLRAIYVLHMLAIGATALSGCSRAPQSTSSSAVAPAPAVPAADPAAPPPESGLQIKRGTVSVAQDRYLFQLCSSADRWSVQGGGPFEALKKYAAGSPQVLFIEARGEFAQAGAAVGAAGNFVIQELLYAAPSSEHSACATARGDYKVWAGGTEPSWSIKIRGDTMTFTQRDAAAHEFVLADAADAEGAVVYRATAADSQSLELIVTREPCRESKTGEYFGFSARAGSGKQTLQGCARPGE